MDKRIYEVMKSIIKYPYPKVCKHWAAMELFKLMDEADIDKDLVKALLESDDDKAIDILNK